MITLRPASVADVPELARLNRQLIADEGHRNAMSDAELERRMHDWIAPGAYRAVFFHAPEPVGYALFRLGDDHVHLRQFFIARGHRRRGIGRAAFAALRANWPPTARLTVDALTANPAAVAFWRAVGFRDYALTLEILPP